MKSNKKRGFTLVELLVVIAILAILATVSVVGYTSFIERAAVSNDENVASQLNQFLLYLTNDSDSEYYQAEIDADNVWYITQYILEEGGLEELVPQSKGNFYFDLSEGKYVVKKDVTDSPLTQIMRAMFGNVKADEPVKVGIGNCFTTGNQYFLVDTAGSKEANLVNAYYNDNSPEDKDFKTFLQENLVDANSTVKNFIGNSVIVSAEGNYTLSGGAVVKVEEQSEVKTNLTIHPDAGVVNLPSESVNPAEGTTITVPENISLFNMGISASAQNVTVHINISDIKLLEDTSNIEEDNTIAEANCLPSNVTVTISGNVNVSYTVVNDKIVVSGTVDVAANLKYGNPIQNFDIVADTTKDQIVLNGDTLYIDGALLLNDGAVLSTANEVGNPSKTTPVSKLEYVWSLKNAVTGVSIDPVTGKLTITDEYNFNSTDPIVVKAENKLTKDGDPTGAGEKAFDEHNIVIVGYKSMSVSVSKGGNDSVGYLSFVKHGASTNYDLIVTPVTNVNITGLGLRLDNSLTITSSDANVMSVNGLTVTVNSAASNPTLTFKYANSEAHTVSTKLYDAENLPIQLKNPDNLVKYVGSLNDLPLDALFTGTVPAGASVMVFKATNGDYIDLSNREPLETTSGAYYVDDTNYDQNYGKSISSLTGAKLSLAGSSVTVGETGKVTEAPVYIAFVQNGVRISPDIPVVIVNANNIATLADFNKSHSNSIVLLDDMVWTYTNGGPTGPNITVSGTQAKPSTIYGNYRKFTINGATLGNGYAYLKLIGYTTMKDLMVIGPMYPKVELQGTNPYGTNTVYADGNNITIENCYISGSRVALSVGNEDRTDTYTNYQITLKNVVLFGGIYANLEMRGGCQLNLTEKVVTVNMPYDNTAAGSKTVGVGMAAWIQTDETKYKIQVADGCDFQQYNFISANDSQYLKDMDISYSGLTVTVLIKDMFSELFTDRTCGKNELIFHRHNNTCLIKYASNFFTDEQSGVVYINATACSPDIDLSTLSSKLPKVGGTLTVNGPNADSGIEGYGYQQKACKVKFGVLTPDIGTFHVWTMDNNEAYTNNWNLFNNRNAAFDVYRPENIKFVGESITYFIPNPNLQ